MKKKLTILGVVILMLIMSVMPVAAAPAEKTSKPINVIECNLEDYANQEDFEFKPILISGADDEDEETIRNYWVVLNSKDEVIYKAEEIRVSKFVTPGIGLNFREEPLIIDGNIYKALPYAAEVQVIGEAKDGWTLVEMDEDIYFCRSEYLSTEKPIVKQQPVKTKSSSDGNSYQAPQTSYTPGNGSRSLGTYSLTAYCPCASCCGSATGITASGTRATAGRTVACNSLPFGTKISINGNIYTVEDRGGMGGNVIDIFFNSHSEALAFGRQSAEVFIVE